MSVRRGRRRRHRAGCADKVRYGTAEEALAEQPSQRAYLCERCGCFHLTTMTF